MNQSEYRVIGMSRSGNHAIINWILSQVRGRSCFINCAEPRSNPFSTARPLDCGRSIIANFPHFNLSEELVGNFSAKDLLVYSHEDCFLGTVATGLFEDNHDAFVGPSKSRKDVLILRDPFNLFASRLRGQFGSVSAMTAVRIWKQHAREFLGTRRYLKQPRVLINYNRWATERNYRQRIAGELELHFSDDSLQNVPAVGNGSSFDGRHYDGRATHMRTLERWKHFMDSEAYAAMFDHEIHVLSRRIFDDVGYPAVPTTGTAFRQTAG